MKHRPPETQDTPLYDQTVADLGPVQAEPEHTISLPDRRCSCGWQADDGDVVTAWAAHLEAEGAHPVRSRQS
ncbi:MAG: hypothetical protein LBU50_03980 [Cellulomonas sp.]|nr:hypothetical protein [Cellulomonas sp.]